jgi:hypothetical protein
VQLRKDKDFRYGGSKYRLVEYETFTAMALVRPIEPSLAQIEAFILQAQEHHDDFFFGHFLTACYQLLPDRTITYSLETPALRFLGIGLSGKHLIIDGTCGNRAGHSMVGRLTINGTVGRMPAPNMIGILEYLRITGEHPGDKMTGLHNGEWTNDPASILDIPPSERDRFLAACMNPDDLPYGEHARQVIERYRSRRER